MGFMTVLTFLFDSIVRVPGQLLSNFGFFMVPVSRTWDKLISFGSELFRRLVASTGGIPSMELLRERDALRTPQIPLESTGDLGGMISRVNGELARLLPRAPEIKLRITATDSESLLSAIVPHYQFASGALLPAGRNGTGLLSLQILMLLLEFGRLRSQSNENFVLAIEEPELHLPPGIQRRIVYRAQSVAKQTIVTSHSPNVVAFNPATSIRLLENREGKLTACSLLDTPLQDDTPNGVRKLFLDNRQDLVAALMQEFVLIPEGRIDYEWFRLLTYCTETKESWDLIEESTPFGTQFGVVPTHDAAIYDTFKQLIKIRKELLVIVDGDSEGDRYIQQLLECVTPPIVIIQWPRGWTIEDLIAWILSDNELAIEKASIILECDQSIDAIKKIMKLDRRNGGVKGNYLLYEDIASIISSNNGCLKRAKELLGHFVKLVLNLEGTFLYFEMDGRSTATCHVRVWKP